MTARLLATLLAALALAAGCSSDEAARAEAPGAQPRWTWDAGSLSISVTVTPPGTPAPETAPGAAGGAPGGAQAPAGPTGAPGPARGTQAQPGATTVTVDARLPSGQAAPPAPPVDDDAGADTDDGVPWWAWAFVAAVLGWLGWRWWRERRRSRGAPLPGEVAS